MVLGLWDANWGAKKQYHQTGTVPVNTGKIMITDDECTIHYVQSISDRTMIDQMVDQTID